MTRSYGWHYPLEVEEEWYDYIDFDDTSDEPPDGCPRCNQVEYSGGVCDSCGYTDDYATLFDGDDQ